VVLEAERGLICCRRKELDRFEKLVKEDRKQEFEKFQ
jgi:hypothetical protein